MSNPALTTASRLKIGEKPPNNINTADFAAPVKYTIGAGGLLGLIAPDTAQYFHYDAQGSLGAVTDDTGGITETYGYDAWGQ